MFGGVGDGGWECWEREVGGDSGKTGRQMLEVRLCVLFFIEMGFHLFYKSVFIPLFGS